MKKISITHIVFAVVAVLLFSTCKRDFINDYKGPAICVPDGFTISNYTVTPEVDFVPDKKLVGIKKDSVVNIYADFSHEVNWDLKIIGRLSKAEKRYAGRSKKIDIKWLGNHDNSIFFKNEICDIFLELNCGYITDSKNFLIKKPTDFSNFGLLLTDFDGNGIFGSTKLGYDSVRQYASYGTNADGSDLIATIDVLPCEPSPQGGNYFYQKATNGDGAYYACGSNTSKNTLGGARLPAGDVTTPSFKNTFPGITNPDSIYVNFFINSNGNSQTSISAYFKSGSRTFNVIINPDWKGWKYLSYKLSEFKSTADGTIVADIKTITFWGFDLQSKDPGPQTVEFAADFVLFTKGKPLFPSLAQ
jgi:hypothetical protein